MELVLNNKFESLDLNELENINGGGTGSKVAIAIFVVGIIAGLAGC